MRKGCVRFCEIPTNLSGVKKHVTPGKATCTVQSKVYTTGTPGKGADELCGLHVNRVLSH